MFPNTKSFKGEETKAVVPHKLLLHYRMFSSVLVLKMNSSIQFKTWLIIPVAIWTQMTIQNILVSESIRETGTKDQFEHQKWSRRTFGTAVISSQMDDKLDVLLMSLHGQIFFFYICKHFAFNTCN